MYGYRYYPETWQESLAVIVMAVPLIVGLVWWGSHERSKTTVCTTTVERAVTETGGSQVVTRTKCDRR